MGTHNDPPSPSLPPLPPSAQPYPDLEPPRFQPQSRQSSRTPPPTSSSPSPRQTQRPGAPIRAATYNTHDHDRIPPPSTHPSHARSEDLNHASSSSHTPVLPASSPRPSPAFLASAASSRPSTPGSTSHRLPSSSGHSNGLGHRTSSTSLASADSESSSQGRPPPTTLSSTSASLTNTNCSACGKPMQGPFVRALGTVFHLGCFKCGDCGDVVASKFFPIEGPDGQQQPLCERDYFRRLNLICAKCSMALRGSYITACNKKFHVEHFTCSLCSTLFGPSDSYYEHEGDVYCHFHYSTRFATKCAGCNSAILKQFVEINRNARDECWHPECYMINKFWNVKVVSPRPTSTVDPDDAPQEPAYVEEEKRESPASLKEKQLRMEQQVYRIWTVLSAFEESSAAYAIRMAERFILHVEVLFATIDDLEYHFARLNMKGMSHVREARMLCRKTVELFTLLSHTQETGSRRMGMTQELLALVTGLAHYLKILIRIALTGALKLERDQSVREAMASFLDKLHLLAVQGANPAARRTNKGQNGEPIIPSHSGGNYGTQGVMYGFRSLAPENAGDPPFREGPTKVSSNNPPSDLCVKCNLTVEEDCVRLGTYQRWHSSCVQCIKCGKSAAVPVPPKEPTPKIGDDKEGKEVTKDQPPKLSTARRPPANVGAFVYEVDSRRDTTPFGDVPSVIVCTEHAHSGCRGGFQPVQRLEQYAFLLNVALRRLYLLLKKQGVVPLSPVVPTSSESDPYRNSGDIMRMKASVHLDRKLSATARLPKRSTIVESPAGRSVHPSDVLHPHRQQEQHSNNQQSQVGQHQGPSIHQSSQQYSSPPISQRAAPPHPGKPHDVLPSQGQSLRPALSRANTEVMIVDDSAPNSPAEGNPPISNPRLDDGITLADIPQLMEAAQAREQQRSLPRESSIPYIAELSPMELAIVKHAAVFLLTKSPLKDAFDLDEVLEMVETKKSRFWKTLFKNEKKKQQKKGVFGVTLDDLVQQEGSDSTLGASREPLRVPSFIDDVISAMRQMDMSIEGIFRKNGNIRRLKDLTEAIDRDPSSVDLTQDNPVQLAALLKKFLRDLPDPLMTFKLHRLFVATQNFPTEAERMRYLHLVSLILPKSHRDTMEIIFVFLKWVASFAHMDAETGSKMDLGNLATVICPSILYARGRDAMRDETFGALRVVTVFLENQDEFFVVPQDFVPMLQDHDFFSNCLDLPGKEFLKKCDTYMKVRGGNGRTIPPPANGSVNNGGPRYQNQNSNGSERPGGAIGPPQSERVVRPPPPVQSSSYQHPPSSQPPPPPPQSAPQALQRIPNQEWTGQGPRPANPVNPNTSVRRSSCLGPSPSPDPPTIPSNNHGYPSAVRQQT
ncbi:hypothetical protein C0993_010783 [Termitomyces sp. T159_Od127]|nr:hypothetical protein C0993_010783 [Termitomyces sp. T159_Od127]